MKNYKQTEEEQMNLGLKEPFSNRLRYKKQKIEIFFIKLRTNSLLKSTPMWFFSFLTISLILVQKNYYDNYFHTLSKEIPLFQISQNLEHRLAENDYLLTILVISGILGIMSFLFALKKYYQFKNLSIMTMGNVFVSILLITIAYIKIFGIYIF